ncbi:hypothetical protein [Candidatus Rariloculus sp.]|uniref:hypothetical protein n=1 Tax=Candidatus Rariloculus sp. TaxID=3101265 RepID=UPI003D115A68
MTHRKRFFWFMLLLAVLFVLRVFAQLLQAVHPVSVLPPFEVWQSGIIAYPVLLSAQIMIIVFLATVLWRVGTQAGSPRRWKYRLCFALGGVYFGLMAFRFVTGLTVFADVPWFSKSVPAFFHMVLAAFLLTLGLSIYRHRGAEHHD